MRNIFSFGSLGRNKSFFAPTSLPNVKTGMPNEKFYKCGVCGFVYPNKELAQRCEQWCREHKSCNTEIVKFAVKENDKNNER